MITVRACRIEELDVLQEISVETFKETFESVNDPVHFASYIERAFHPLKLERELIQPNSQFFFAMMDDQVVGYLKLNTDGAQTEEMGDEALEIERIYVRRHAQGNGVGKALYHHAVACAVTLNKTKLWLGVWEFNDRALAFYRRQHFIEVGSHTFYMGDEPQVDLIMAKTLHP